jgi:hypothetical protein
MINHLRSEHSRLRVTLQIETQNSGKIAASAIEFPDCRVEATTREEAISKVQASIVERLSHVETIPWDVPMSSNELSWIGNGSKYPAESPWIKFAGMFQDDPDFAKITANIRAEREIEDDSEVDPSVYSLEG